MSSATRENLTKIRWTVRTLDRYWDKKTLLVIPSWRQMKTTEDISFFALCLLMGWNTFWRSILNFCTIELIHKNTFYNIYNISIISLNPLSVSYLSFYEFGIKNNKISSVQSLNNYKKLNRALIFQFIDWPFRCLKQFEVLKFVSKVAWM